MTYEQGPKREVAATVAPILGDPRLPETKRIEQHLAELKQIAKQIAWGHGGVKHLFGIDLDKNTGRLVIVPSQDQPKGVHRGDPPALCEFPTILRDVGILDQAVAIGNRKDIDGSQRAKLLGQLYIDHRDAICERFEAFTYTMMENAFLATNRNLGDPNEPKIIERTQRNSPTKQEGVFHQYAQDISINGRVTTKLYFFDWRSTSPSERPTDLQVACEEKMFLTGDGISNEIPMRDKSWRTRTRSTRAFVDGIPTRHSSEQFAPMGTLIIGDLVSTGREPAEVKSLGELEKMLSKRHLDKGTIYKVDPLTVQRLERKDTLNALEFDNNLQNLLDNKVAMEISFFSRP